MGGRDSSDSGGGDTRDPKHQADSSSTTLRKSIDKVGSMDEKNKVTRDWVTQHMTPGTTVITNPETSVEHDAHSVTIDGITVYFDSVNDAVVQDIRELVAGDHIPSLLKEAVDAIQIIGENAPVNQNEIGTEHEGVITIFANEPFDAGEFAHEMAHAMAEAKWGSVIPPEGSAYRAAIDSGEQPVSAYGSTNAQEDFAEAARLYVTDPDNLKSVAPRRYGVISQLMKNRSYNG